MTEPTSSPLRQQPIRSAGVSTGAVAPAAAGGPAPEPTVEHGVSDTQPIPVVTRVDPTAVGPVLLVRAGLALLGAVAAVVAAVFLFRHGLSEHVYPAFLAGTDHTDVIRYRGPWIGGAAGAVLVAGLLVIQAIGDLGRRAASIR